MMTIINFLVCCAALALFFYIGSFVLTFVISLIAMIIAAIVAVIKAIFGID